MTAAQVDYLRCVADYGELGWSHVDLQFAVMRNLPPDTEKSTCQRVAFSLLKRGLIEGYPHNVAQPQRCLRLTDGGARCLEAA